jgi:hypothetical protein
MKTAFNTEVNTGYYDPGQPFIEVVNYGKSWSAVLTPGQCRTLAGQLARLSIRADRARAKIRIAKKAKRR